MENVLITGGAGFIGYHLVHRMSQAGYHVDIIDNLQRGTIDNPLKSLLKDDNVGFINIDLLNKDDVLSLSKDYSFIFNLAAIVGVRNVLKDAFNVLKSNMLITSNILELCKRQERLKRFFYFSTSEVYAGTLHYFGLTIPTPEDTPLTITPLENPRTSYMLSKIYGEALTLHCQYIPFFIIRPHNIYGPRMGMAHVIPELLKKAFYAQPNTTIEVFSVKHKRTFCYIDDFIECLLRLVYISEKSDNYVLNIGSDAPEHSIEEVARLVIKIVGKELRILPKPPTPGSPHRRCPDISLLKRLIDFTPKVLLDDGIRTTFNWYKENYFD